MSKKKEEAAKQESFQMEIQRINDAGFFPNVMLTKVGYPSPGERIEDNVILLTNLKDDIAIKGIMIYSADDPNSNWFNGNLLEGYARDMADHICPVQES